MSCSLDANILLYASDESSPHYRQATDFLKACVEGSDLLCLTWMTVMAYQRIATHPRIFQNPLSPTEAWDNIRRLLAQPRVRMLVEAPDFAEHYEEVASAFPVRGNLVPDAHLAAILRQHGVGVLFSADADFRKFTGLKVINPFSRK